MDAPKHQTIDDLVPTEVVPIESLTVHPRNYKAHPEDQIEHLIVSLQEFGQTKNVVVARDGTILAGHGIVEAAFRADWTTIEVRRLDLDPESPDALKLLALDNEVGRRALTDDRALSELLREVASDATAGLLGTGYDDDLLAALVLISRPTSEIRDRDAAAEWVGMPDYTPEGNVWKLVVQFVSVEDRDRFLDETKLRDVVYISKVTPYATSAWWPKPDSVRHDSSVAWEPDLDA